MTPQEYGAHLASLTAPITDEQARKAAIILAVEVEQVAA